MEHLNSKATNILKRLRFIHKKQSPNTVITIKDNFHIIFDETVKNPDITEITIGLPFVDNGEVKFEPQITLILYYDNFYPTAIRCDRYNISKVAVIFDKNNYPNLFYREWQKGITKFANQFLLSQLLDINFSKN